MGKVPRFRGSLLTAAAATVLGLANPANAVVVGPVDFGSYTGPATVQFNGYSTETNTTVGTDETTWGAGFVTSIFKTGSPGTSFYNIGAGGDKIGFMIYGIADASITGSSPNFQIYNVGCAGGPCDGNIHIDFYDLPPGTNTNFGTGATDLKPSDRTGFSSFTGITGGSLYMSWELTPGKVTLDDPTTLFDETLATLFQNVNSATLPASGDGKFFAECVAGPACPFFENNAFVGGADFDGRFTLEADSASGWGGNISDPVRTNVQAVPEPATLGLLGVGLLFAGFVSNRRKKNRAQA
jgi:PEP-CTERM motif-containing protein